jgi:predicted peroxiredoxin
MNVVILLTLSPEHQDPYTVSQLSLACLKQGHHVHIFVMDDGVYNLARRRSAHGLISGFDEVLKAGGGVTLCSVSAEMRNLAHDDVLEGVAFGSQYDLAQLVSRADRFLSFA